MTVLSSVIARSPPKFCETKFGWTTRQSLFLCHLDGSALLGSIYSTPTLIYHKFPQNQNPPPNYGGGFCSLFVYYFSISYSALQTPPLLKPLPSDA